MVWVDSDPEIPNPNLQLLNVQSNIYKRSQETSQEPKPVIAQILWPQRRMKLGGMYKDRVAKNNYKYYNPTH